MTQPEVEPRPTHRRIGWLELFYDLVFVAVIGQLAGRLHGDPSLLTMASTGGLMVLLWTAWFNMTTLTNLSGGLAPTARPFVFVSMIGVAVMALGMGDLAQHGGLLALGYALARTALYPLWAAGRRHRKLGQLRAVLFGPGLGTAWAATAWLPQPWIWVGWAALVTAEIALSLIRPGTDREHVRYDSQHLMERIGLFIMVVLGQSVVGLVHTLQANMTGAAWVVAGLGFALLCAYWWLFYDSIVERIVDALRGAPEHVVDFIGGGQFLVMVGLVGVAGGLSGAVEHAATGPELASHLSRGSLKVLCGGVALFTLGISTLSLRVWLIRTGPGTPRRYSAQGWVIASLGAVLPPLLVWLLGEDWPPWLVLAALLVVASALVGKQVAQDVGVARLDLADA